MNTIGKIQLQFGMQNQDFAHSLYGRWENFFTHCVEEIADEVLEKLILTNEEFNVSDLLVDTLELDLGSILEEEFDEKFPQHFREKLEAGLLQFLQRRKQVTIETQENSIQNKSAIKNRKPTATESSIPHSSLQTLKSFLLSGVLPWHASGDDRDIHKLFAKALQESSREFKQFLQSYGHYSSLQQRLVYQFTDFELEKGIGLIMPEVAYFIVGYVHLLKAKYKETQQTQTTESQYRNAVWMVVYAYLFTLRSSYFDKRSFLTQTILQLASKYNLSYDSLLSLLTREIDTFRKKHPFPIELIQLLDSLKKELSEKRLLDSFLDAAQFYKKIIFSLKNEIDKEVSQASHEGLFRILANPYSCKQFLQHLNEKEIIQLLPIVLSGDSNFVLVFARHLDQTENEKSESAAFSLTHLPFIKWQLIFPILLEKRGTRFNRKQFVRSVLQQVAAHYNVDFHELLLYFIQSAELITNTDKELKSLFLELKKEYARTLNENGLDPCFTIHLLHKEDFHFSAKEDFVSIFNSRISIQELIEHTSESERIHFIQEMYFKEQTFILSYIKLLDKSYETNALQGKAGSGFGHIKWTFLLTVLSQMSKENFNRRYFVSQVLQQQAAHYNLDYVDLLMYFHQEMIQIQLPYHLEQILLTLYEEIKSEKEKVVYTRPNEAGFEEEKQAQSKTSSPLAYFIKTDQTPAEEQLIKQLQLQFDFLYFAEPAIKILPQLINYIRKEFNRIIDNLQLLDFFFRLSIDYKKLSRLEILNCLLEFIQKQVRFTSSQQQKWDVKLLELSKQNPILATYSEVKKEMSLTSQEERPTPLKWKSTEKQVQFISNAGMVLLSPYFPRLFTLLHLMDEGVWKDEEAQYKAMYLIQYAVFGQTDFPEQEMLLNKLLVGLKSEIPVPTNILLTQAETDTVDSMLQGVLQHWETLNNTSVEGLRGSFLIREGKLEEKQEDYLLSIEEKTYDILLDTLPWSFKTINYSWIDKIIHVRWR